MKKVLIVLGVAMVSLFAAPNSAFAQLSDYACEMNPPYGIVYYQESGHGAAVSTCQYLVSQALTNYCASAGDTDPWQLAYRVWYFPPASSPYWIFLDNIWVQCVGGSPVYL